MNRTVADETLPYVVQTFHDGANVPLAPKAWRVENGRNSGNTGPEIASALGIEIMHVIAGVRDEQWFVEDDTAGERFRVHDGQITEIEAVVPATDI